MESLRKCVIAALLLAGIDLTARAGIVVYEKDGRSIEIGGRIQVQYVSTDPDCPAGEGCLLDEGLDTSDSTVDSLHLRRLRPYVEASLNERWSGKIEAELGEASDDDELQVKDAYIERSFAGSKTQLFIGNTKPPYSREFITSSTRLQTIERSFLGDHNFGALDRVLGVRVTGQRWGDKLGWGAAAGMASHDPDANRLDFDSPVNQREDWNEGRTVAARIDLHPLGHVPFSQGDFEGGSFKFVVSAGAFLWGNDGDNDTYPLPTTRVDLDESHGVELSGALRGHRLSIDAEVQRVKADTVTPGFTGGLYRDGSSTLDKLGVVAGYMLVEDRFEIVAAWDTLDADNYEQDFSRTTVGVSYFIRAHDIKLQLDYRVTRNLLGLADQDPSSILAMMQYVF